ncbi:MAG: hypothetical protein MJZ37_06290 [Bacilli bacterium]|nr:hypothetical protein [Bacilli bacterium]
MRWGQYDFCKDCKYRVTKCYNGDNEFYLCSMPIKSKLFPKHCQVPEREEIEGFIAKQAGRSE